MRSKSDETGGPPVASGCPGSMPPITTCVLTWFELFPGSADPRLLRTASRIPILPMSCSRPARADQVDLLIGHAGAEPRPWRGKIGDAGGMAPGGVLGLEGVDQGLERGHRDRSSLARSRRRSALRGGDLLLEPRLCFAARAACAPADRRDDGSRRVAGVDRLDEIVHGAALHAECGGVGVVDPGEHQDRVAAPAPGAGGRARARGSGIRTSSRVQAIFCRWSLDRFLAGGGGDDLVAVW